MAAITSHTFDPDAQHPVSLPFLESVSQTLTGRVIVAVGATAVIAVAAHVSIPLPFTPVPLTLSDFAVLLVGMALGPVAGFSALLLYLAEGAVGLPVFNPQGLGGLAQLLGPTAGYLFAYPFAAALAGYANTLRRKGLSDFSAGVLAATAATFLILASGATWIGHIRGLSPAYIWYIAVAPFLLGAAIKIVASSMIFSSMRQWLRS